MASNKDIKLGPQVSKFSVGFLMSILTFLCFAFLLLTIYSIIKDNLVFFDPTSFWVRHKNLFNYTLLDSKTSCTIFITLLSLIIIRKHFVLGFKPQIVYESNNSYFSYTEKMGGDLWVVQILNSGLGAAVVDYSVFALNTENSNTRFISYEEIIDYLSQNGLAADTDYFLPYISKGFVFPAKDERIVFKIKSNKIIPKTRICLKIYFKDFVGHRYEKHIELLPSVLPATTYPIKPSQT